MEDISYYNYYSMASLGAALMTLLAVVLGLKWTARHQHSNDVTRSSKTCSTNSGQLQAPDENQIDDTKLVANMINSESEEIIKEVLEMPRYDPLEFCNHIQAQVKRLMLKMAQRDIEHQMTDKQRQTEQTVKINQLDAIVCLMKMQQQQQLAETNHVRVDDANGKKSLVCSSNNSAREFDVIREQMKMYIE